VKFTIFVQNCPKNEHLTFRIMQQSVRVMKAASASEELEVANSPASALAASQVPS
jgi:hypothetical protein